MTTQKDTVAVNLVEVVAFNMHIVCAIDKDCRPSVNSPVAARRNLCKQ